MRIVRVEGFRKELHLAGAGIRMASANTTTITDVYLLLTAEDGRIGYGVGLESTEYPSLALG
jgi:hypothetical protein